MTSGMEEGAARLKAAGRGERRRTGGYGIHASSTLYRPTYSKYL